MGEALGCREAAAEAIAAYDERAAEVRAALAAARPDETVLLLRVRESDIRVYGGARRSGTVLYEDLGLTAHESVSLTDNHTAVSPDHLPWLDADHIFLMLEDADRMAVIEGSDVWQHLPAVQVYPVSSQPWNPSVGPISFSVIIDAVEAALLAPAAE